MLLVVTQAQATVRLSQIINASWALDPTQNANQYMNMSGTTCDQCLCGMLEMNNLSTSIACQPARMTCQFLFWNTTARLQIDMNSIVYLSTTPSLPQTEITQQPVTTSTESQCKTTSLPKGVERFRIYFRELIAHLRSENNPTPCW